MSTRELIDSELDRMPQHDLDQLLCLLQNHKDAKAEAAMPTVAAESSPSKDWLSPEEDVAWANL